MCIVTVWILIVVNGSVFRTLTLHRLTAIYKNVRICYNKFKKSKWDRLSKAQTFSVYLPYNLNVITWFSWSINITAAKCGTYRQTEQRDSAYFTVAVWLLFYVIAKTEFQSSQPSRYDLRPAIFVKGCRPWWVFLMQSAHFYKIFLKKKLVKLELKFYRSASLQTKTTSRDVFEPVLRVMEIC